MTSEPASEIFETKDGRRIGYCQWGQANGFPVLFLQGWPGSRLLGTLLQQAASRRNVRLLTVDRPGIGLSSPLPNRTLLDWPKDIDALLARLGISELALVGHSAGGAYAMACNVGLGAKVKGMALLGSLGPIEVPAVSKTIPRLQRVIMQRSAGSKQLGWGLASAISAASHWAPDALIRVLLSSLSSADQEILRRPAVLEAIKVDIAEALRQGPAGLAQEAAVNNGPWGLSLRDISGPVFLYHGHLDRSLPVEMGRVLAAAIPNCRATYPTHAGHYWFIDHFDEVLEHLLNNE